jgi:ABC-type lipoprotein release transport system permease subunit
MQPQKFILQIIKFKKTVNAFILTNIILLILFNFVITFFTIHSLKCKIFIYKILPLLVFM